MKSILVTGIGGVVGQGILRNLLAMNLNVPVVGTNTVKISAGNHLCDHVYEVPFAYDGDYVATIKDLVTRHEVGLVIPSTDYEAYYLSLNEEALSCRVAASPPEVTGFCLDKYLNFQEFESAGLPFAQSSLPSAYRGEFAKTVVKPREGRGSRNIVIDPARPTDFGDDYVVQEYLNGPELTTTFYVLQTGGLHGLITMERELEQGNTARCEVVFDHDETLLGMIRRIIARFPFKGSCNIQSRVTRNGVIPFEINCRISGTNSVRSQLGFNDVAYTVQELFLNQLPDQPHILKGSAIRIIHDVIYPDKSLSEISNSNDHFWTF
ncbi:ATP-grasp domain-containing protein [Herbaspirillum lusitanum]|uniref:ATP-grasp domain-containing protein n=1 Tax=Herbaspirillum lusitanum TaxID=213312 RepID=UPI00036A04B4|nr:ATP-grasp domain-containing protein [Herbaspirillum lusitanum]